MDPGEELNQELKKARAWILGVGILMVLFTVALVNGIKSGARASQLQEQLGKVFE